MLCKLLAFVKKSIFCSTALAAVASLINPNLVSAASFSFRPSGSELDLDLIWDLVPEDTITFDLFLDTTGLPPGDDPSPTVPHVSNFTADFKWDGTELDFVNFGDSFFDWENRVGIGVFFPGVPLPGKLPTNGSLVLSNPIQNFNGKVGEITFNVKNLENDGKFDFSIDVIEAFILRNSNFVDVSANFGQQEVEVQPTPEPSTILGLVSILGLTLFSKKLKTKN